MSRLGSLVLACWIGLAVWLSDQWAWLLPALIGVIVGLSLERAQRSPQRRSLGVPPSALGSLLILSSLAYLYVVFLIFVMGRESRSVLGLALGLLLLTLVLGLLIIRWWKGSVPSWVSRLWEALLKEW